MSLPANIVFTVPFAVGLMTTFLVGAPIHMTGSIGVAVVEQFFGFGPLHAEYRGLMNIFLLPP